MDALTKFNNEWQQLFQKRRLNLITSKSPKLIDFLANARVMDLQRLNSRSVFEDWRMVIVYRENTYTFENFEDDEFEDCNQFFDEMELSDFIDFIFDLNISQCLRSLAGERFLLNLLSENPNIAVFEPIQKEEKEN